MADSEKLKVAGLTITILKREYHFDADCVTICFEAAQVREVPEKRLKEVALLATVGDDRRRLAGVTRLDETRFLVGLISD